jgi:signal transduction histidine kinase
MNQSIARQVATAGTVILVVTLVLVGVGTAAVLHTQRVEAQDEALLAAAHGRAHPDVADTIEVEHSRSPVESWLVQPDSVEIPRDLAEQATETERPVFLETAEKRIVLLPFEIYVGDEDTHHLAAASAPKLTLARTVGPFALVYGVLAAVAALVATFVQARVVRRSFEPIERARREADRVVALGEGRRLSENAPEEIQPLLRAINELLDRLDVAYQAQSRFTAEAAHELRTPVTAMLGELDVALRGTRSEDSRGTRSEDSRGARSEEEDRQVLESVREEVSRLRRLVEGLTAMARIDAGQVDRGRELVRAAEVANAALRAEARTLEEAGNPVRLQIDADPELEVHRSLLEVALANLLRNAARHAPGAEVVVRVSREDELAVFEVDDAGPGVAPEQREALFDRFARAGEARRKDRSGLGLGLPIAREVARRHGGDCTLEESPSGGLRARLAVRSS